MSVRVKMTDAAGEAALDFASRFTTVGSEQWHLLVQAISEHTAALQHTLDLWNKECGGQSPREAIAAHTEAALKEWKRSNEMWFNEAKKANKEAEGLQAALAGKEVYEDRLRMMSKMLRYIAFVLTGEEQADSQLAADRARAVSTPSRL